MDFSFSGPEKKSQYKGHTSTEEKTKPAVGEPVQREVTYTMNYIDSAPSSLQQTLLLIRHIVQPDSALTEKSLLDITPNLKELRLYTLAPVLKPTQTVTLLKGGCSCLCKSVADYPPIFSTCNNIDVQITSL